MKYIVLISGLHLLLFSAYPKNNKNHLYFHSPENQIIHGAIDTSIIVILPIKSANLFSKNEKPKPLNLTEDDLIKIETILITCVKTYNKNPDIQNDTLNLNRYKRQYVPYILNGEKKVYVNCFNKLMKDFPNWKKDFVAVDGGGSSFFFTTINLTTEKCIQFWVNAPL